MMEMPSNYFTVVFKIDDREKFQQDLDKFTSALSDESVFDGAQVTGCGWGDLMSESEIYFGRLMDNDIEPAEVPE